MGQEGLSYCAYQLPGVDMDGLVGVQCSAVGFMAAPGGVLGGDVLEEVAFVERGGWHGVFLHEVGVVLGDSWLGWKQGRWLVIRNGRFDCRLKDWEVCHCDDGFVGGLCICLWLLGLGFGVCCFVNL